MDDFNKPPFKDEKYIDEQSTYRPRRYNLDQVPEKKKSWVLPIVLLLIGAAAFGLFWSLGGISRLQGIFSSRENQAVNITLPRELLRESKNEEALRAVFGAEDREEEAENEEGILQYNLTAAERASLLEIAKNNLDEKIVTLKNNRQDPYLVDLSHDSAYIDYFLVIDRALGKNEQAIVEAAELFMLAVFYQHIVAGPDPAPEVTVTLEELGSGNLFHQLVYPNDLARSVELLETAALPIEIPSSPQIGDQVIVATGLDNLNLRNGPEITYLIIAILRSGTILEVTETEGLWLKVITPDGKEGWVHGGFVE